MQRSVTLSEFQSIVTNESNLLAVFFRTIDEYRDQRQILADLKKEYGQQIVILYVGPNSEEYLNKKYNIIGSPTYMYMNYGVLAGKLLGCIDYESISGFIKQMSTAVNL